MVRATQPVRSKAVYCKAMQEGVLCPVAKSVAKQSSAPALVSSSQMVRGWTPEQLTGIKVWHHLQGPSWTKIERAFYRCRMFATEHLITSRKTSGINPITRTDTTNGKRRKNSRRDKSAKAAR